MAKTTAGAWHVYVCLACERAQMRNVLLGVSVEHLLSAGLCYTHGSYPAKESDHANVGFCHNCCRGATHEHNALIRHQTCTDLVFKSAAPRAPRCACHFEGPRGALRGSGCMGLFGLFAAALH